MQYIFNEEEHSELLSLRKEKIKINNNKNALEEARIYILELAKFTCIHEREWNACNYCDNCPCSPISHNLYSDWKLICSRDKSYSK